MGIEKKFVEEGLKQSQMNEYFNRELERAGYGGMEINRTPLGTHITIAHRLGFLTLGEEREFLVRVGAVGKMLGRLITSLRRAHRASES